METRASSTRLADEGRSFDEIPDPVALLDRLVSEALTSFHADLQRWYKREQEVVSLFAFGHLVPRMLRERIDVGQLVIEGRMSQVVAKKDAKPHPRKPQFDIRVRRDLVFRNRRHDGCFRDQPNHPFAVMEWKLSVARRTSRSIRRQFETDLSWLADNATLMRVGYCVLVEWPNGSLAITCARVFGTEVQRDFVLLPTASAVAARG